MSKGLGHVGRAIAAAFDAYPDDAFTTFELCGWAYGEEFHGVRSERVAVLRAVKGLAKHRPDLDVAIMRTSETRGGEAVFYRRYRVLSYAIAHLKTSYREKVRDAAPDKLDAMLAPGGEYHRYVVPGGRWWRRTEIEILRRDGDHATADRLEAEAKREHEQMLEAYRAAFAGEKPFPTP